MLNSSLVTVEVVGAALGVSLGKLKSLIRAGRMPRPILLSHKIRWRRSEIEYWLSSSEAITIRSESVVADGELCVYGVCDYLQIGRSILFEMIRDGKFPNGVKRGTVLVWNQSIVDRWIDEQPVEESNYR